MGRLRDAAVRGALGASRVAPRSRGSSSSSSLLAGVGGALGVAWSREAALRLFVTTAPVSIPRVHEVAHRRPRRRLRRRSWRCVAALAVAVLPAWRVGRGDLQTVLRSRRHGTSDRRRPAGVRGTLLATQVALSVMLLAVGGLFVSEPRRVCCAWITGFAAEGVDDGRNRAGRRALPGHAGTCRALRSDSRARPRDAGRHRRGLDLGAAAHRRDLGRRDRSRIPIACRDREGRAPTTGSSDRSTSAPSAMPILQGRSIDARDRTSGDDPGGDLVAGGADAPGPARTRSAACSRVAIPRRPAPGRRRRRRRPHDGARQSDSPLMVYVPYWYNNEGKSVLVVRSRDDAHGGGRGGCAGPCTTSTPMIAIADGERRSGQVVDTAARRPPLSDVVVQRLRRGGAGDRDRRRLRDDGATACRAAGARLNIRVALGARASRSSRSSCARAPQRCARARRRCAAPPFSSSALSARASRSRRVLAACRGARARLRRPGRRTARRLGPLTAFAPRTRFCR